MFQAQKEEKLRKLNADYEARHLEDSARYDAQVERSKILVAKANLEYENVEQKTTLRIQSLELQNRMSKVRFYSQVLSFILFAKCQGKNRTTRAGKSRVSQPLRRSHQSLLKLMVLKNLIFY
jgi:hypothetical protein